MPERRTDSELWRFAILTPPELTPRAIGEEHDPELHLIPPVLQAAAELPPNVTVFGAD